MTRFDSCFILIWFTCVPINVLSAIFFPRTWGYYLSDMDAAATFRRPNFYGYNGMQSAHQIPGGVYLSYPQRQPMPVPYPGNYPSTAYNPESESAKPAQWSPLVANEHSESSTSSIPNTAQHQIVPHPNLRVPYPTLSGQPPPTLFMSRPILPIRPQLLPEETRGTHLDESASTNPSQEGESEALAGFFTSNWGIFIVAMLLIVCASLGVAGYFVWRKRFGSSNINAETPPPAATN